MRVLLSTYGSRGDVEPLLALAVQLRALGADVRVCAPPDFEGLLAGAGVTLVPVGPSARELTKLAPPPSSLPERAAGVIAAQFSAIPAAAGDCDAMVATGMLPAAAGALSVAEMVGIPSVYVSFQKLVLPSPDHAPLAYPGRPFPPGVRDNRVLWELDALSVDALFGEALNGCRARNGLPPVDHVRDYVIGARPWLAADPVLDPWPSASDLAVVQTGAWFQPDDRPLPADLEAFLDAGAPPVYVGFGSMPMHSAENLPRVVVESVRAQGRRAIVSHGWADLSPDADDCFVLGEANHQALFPRVAAVVHHGGAGTTSTATRSGTPQVVVPQLADQPYWARRVADLGIGVAHDGPAPTLESLSSALRTALLPEFRARAAAVAATTGADGAAVAAGLLVEMSAGRVCACRGDFWRSLRPAGG
ncbi:glycosyltransferase [Amycolatopsis saalfeldensis]|uniref:UDP:flavonoid glycosyltransferase YjiC, YdhE family n=1 Tax=Amycolatopsis saalfeldensis TaxID=394193 RepID=A0A1H8URU8_9PSEU|nr:glycosyltransferase [Amycolatopsis saalfeldensis]SEP05318.1 UDP:flavonoid glycosyltransferase YjiC, YdhE family [Amycolatopsis saalfeldensis]